MRKLTLICLLLSQSCLAVETDKAAHAGVSFALNSAFYGLYSKAFKMPKAPATAFALATTLLIGFAKEGMDAASRPGGFDYGDMGANALGAGSSAALNWTFDF